MLQKQSVERTGMSGSVQMPCNVSCGSSPSLTSDARRDRMESFVAYLDILGTKDLVSRGKFSDAHVLDFTGAVVGAAPEFQSARFAAFSDSVILSAPPDKLADLVST